MPDPKTINLVDQNGIARAVPENEAQYHLDRGWKIESAEGRAERIAGDAEADVYGGAVGTIAATGAGAARSITGGLTDVALGALGGQRTLSKLREHNQVASTVGEIGGTLLPVGMGGVAARAGARAGAVAEGAGALRQIAGAARGAAVEGGILSAGQAVSEIALSDDPLTIENVASTMKSHVLFGGLTGGAVGAAGKGIGIGLRRAKSKLDDIAASTKTADIADAATADVAALDRKGLRAAEKAEIDAIEAARVPQRAELAKEVKAFRQELKENKLWLATKGAEESEIRAIGRRTLKADKALDNLLDDPKALAENPKAALSHLRKQEAALDDLVNKHGDSLRAKFASDTSGDRVAALDFASKALERNRGLQAKLTEISAKPTSARLDAIADAMAGGATKKAAPSLGDAIGDAGLGYAVGAAAGLPIIGQAIAAARIGKGIVNKLGLDASAAAARGSKAVQTFLDVGSKVAPQARVVASRTLANASYGEVAGEKPKKGKAGKVKAPTLAASFNARSAELRSLTAPGPDGAPVMRPEARQKMAERLRPVAAADPVLADKIETNRARAVEFLVSKLPPKPDLPGVDGSWPTSDMEMRAFARYVAAVEDPQGIVERLATGEVTPEDAEAMKAVYPEMFAQIQMEIMSQIGELRSKLPYQRRLALSIFSGVPVDPALDPAVLAVLQGSFAIEEGTEGGIQAPVAQPAFGSISREKGTPSQERMT